VSTWKSESIARATLSNPATCRAVDSSEVCNEDREWKQQNQCAHVRMSYSIVNAVVHADVHNLASSMRPPCMRTQELPSAPPPGLHCQLT
jgi:hypothetical protein